MNFLKKNQKNEYYLKEGVFRNIINSFIRLCCHIPFVNIAYFYFHSKKHNNDALHLKTISVKDYCALHSLKYQVVEDEMQREVFEPAYYDKGKGKKHLFKSPSIYYAELDDAIVLGGTALIIIGDKVLTDIPARDTENRVAYNSGKPITYATRKEYYIELPRRNTRKIGCAISLLGLASTNYYHFTLEILSRYGYLKELYEEVPVLIDGDIRKIPQLVEILRTIVGSNIVFVDRNERVLVENLIYPSMNTWMPINVKGRLMFRASDNIISKSAVQNIRKAVQGELLPRGDKKLFISRRNLKNPRLVNEEDVQKVFLDEGFEVIYPEEMTFLEQVRAFSSARCVVGASGASLTNLIYCNPNTVFGCIIPHEYNFYIYSTIAYFVNCRQLFLDAEIIKRDKYFSADQLRVNIDECKRYAAELIRMCNPQSIYEINDKQTICMVTNWYPTINNPFQGLFFKEQSIAMLNCFNFLVVHFEIINSIFRDKNERVDLNYEDGIKEIKINFYVSFIKRAVYYIRGRFGGAVGPYEKLYGRAFRKLVKSNIDCFYCVSGQTEAYYTRAFARAICKPYVVSEHGVIPWVGTSVSEVTRQAIEEADLVLVISKDKLRQIKMQNINVRNYWYVGNMVDGDLFTFNPIKHDIITFIAVGSYSFYKNYNMLISVFEKLSEICDSAFTLLILGYKANEGYAKNAEELEQKIKKCNFADRVEMIPSISHEMISEQYNRADALVMTSIQEGQPVSAIEAACCGLPIFSTRCGGVEDYVSNKMGRLFDIDDVDGFAEGLKEFIEGKIFFNQEEIRETVMQRFGKTAFVNNMKEAFDSVINKEC